MAPVPLVTRAGIESLLTQHRAALDKQPGQCLVLVHGRYEPGERTEFRLKPVEGKQGERAVRVTDQPSVLGIAAEWLDYQDTGADSGVLVVTTGVDPAELDWDLRGHALDTGLLRVDPVEILRFRFGANRLDPRVWQSGWLVQALLDAEPTGGWPRRGGVLTYDDALLALIGQRLGVDATALDLDRLLDWSRGTGPVRWGELDNVERDGISEWLVERLGPAAETVLTLVSAGRGRDALALGVVGTALADPSLPREALVSVGGLFPGIRSDAVEAFSSAVDGTLSRWITAAGPEESQTRHDVLAVLERADELAHQAGLGEALSGSTLLPSAWRARLRTLATALPDPKAASLALGELRRHRLADLLTDQKATATMAVRLARWLAAPDPGVPSVAAGVRRQVTEWGWVDYAVAVLWAGDAATDPVSAKAYHDLCEQAVARRAASDEEFSRRLASWVPHARAQLSEGALLIEDVLATVAAPLTGDAVPVVIVLDGMSASAAVQLGDELGRRPNWLEATPVGGTRLSAVSAFPSITRVSRPSLLCGKPVAGGQTTEKEGFAAFWKRHHKLARLFHENEVGGGAGQSLNPDLVAALAGDEVVGVVLNTIDDTLGPGREGDGTTWRLQDIRYLNTLLTQARSYGRPVVLTSDHGHVLERGRAAGPSLATGDYGARWRTGTAADGEVELRGPRVLEGDGKVVLPWREDLRYTQKRAGYHGGAALAEVSIPVLVLLPSVDALPDGWAGLASEQTTPSWWRDTPEPVTETTTSVPKPSRKKPKSVPDGPGLFDHLLTDTPEPAPAPPRSIGQEVVKSKIFGSQKAFVRRAPDVEVIAAVIDSLVEAGGKLSLAAIAATAGKAARNIDGFLATVQRLLNVESYPVFELIDGGRTVELNIELLRTQFQLGKP
ncbi:BREX-2 system phosphatase PglZ [Amycolatopsis anabasis]|uniref:BREX-2 system phosphatase PglZ n=1 Tax=Amycolatopsis anabasis TaxID=1840409 RepID=UPI00131D0CA3|nr:BREX-2 system phosphatase PglZ [Amycolatopsis anabasis]